MEWRFAVGLNPSFYNVMASEGCKTTPKFLEKIPTKDLIVLCRTG